MEHTDNTSDRHTTPAEGLIDIFAPRRSPAQRIADMKAADQDAATAAPIIIAVPDHPDALNAVQDVVERLGAEAAERRYLVALVDRLLAGAAHAADRAALDAAHEPTKHTEAIARGANLVNQALTYIMNDRGNRDGN